MYASRYGASFVDKNSKKMNIDLREIVSDDLVSGISFSVIPIHWKKWPVFII